MLGLLWGWEMNVWKSQNGIQKTYKMTKTKNHRPCLKKIKKVKHTFCFTVFCYLVGVLLQFLGTELRGQTPYRAQIQAEVVNSELRTEQRL